MSVNGNVKGRQKQIAIMFVREGGRVVGNNGGGLFQGPSRLPW